jgi:RNA polymerase sigma factor (sigma-70 family)
MDAPAIMAGRAPASGLGVTLGLFGDERLARLVGSGSERAFRTIYERYHQPLYRYCRSIVRDDADAQDALQSTLASAFVALKRGQRDAPLRPWLFRIAHNEAISLIRRRPGTREITDAPEQSAPSAEDRAGERARLALLVADLKELPDRQRGALLMRELSGLSHEEIAIALDTSVGTAKQAILEARRGLLELGEGRSMACEDIRRTVSNGDRRALRGRRLRAHLRDCTACAAFAAAIPARRDDLHALVPVLAPTASAAMLARVMGAGSGHSAGGGGAVAAGAAGKTVGVTLATKALLGAAVLVSAAASVTGMRAMLTHQHHDTSRPVGAHNAGRTARGVPGRTFQSATGAHISLVSGPSANGAHHGTLGGRATGPSSSLTPSSGGVATGSGTAHRGLGASGTMPTQAHGKPARSVAGGRRAGSGTAAGRRAGGLPSSRATGHPSGADGSHSTTGVSEGHSGAGGSSGSPSAGTPAASGPPLPTGRRVVPEQHSRGLRRVLTVRTELTAGAPTHGHSLKIVPDFQSAAA